MSPPVCMSLLFFVCLPSSVYVCLLFFVCLPLLSLSGLLVVLYVCYLLCMSPFFCVCLSTLLCMSPTLKSLRSSGSIEFLFIEFLLPRTYKIYSFQYFFLI
uniref:Uncharacterized protein n=1 Tax=Cacopsylla melanoneura TaxID=428564 RepID=A0A8D8ZZE0_9HEMI